MTDGNGATVAPGGTTTSPDITFEFSSPDGDLDHFECTTVDVPFATCSSPFEFTGLPDGTYTFFVRAVDTAGNSGLSTSFTWTVDTSPPSVTIDSAIDGNNAVITDGDTSTSNTITFSFSSTDTDTDHFECSIDDTLVCNLDQSKPVHWSFRRTTFILSKSS